ncbi:hypothetical protein GIB67_019301 [Kingdonia uniflora]|uniref:Uncharacterized protein n=1 Tax=Kingdonia uniflora TaxID=39325 RepID=A0A7J7L1G6_9MAGN|nr:hypothetical protein GIB67_019301 [Kingdonia uniflora]
MSSTMVERANNKLKESERQGKASEMFLGVFIVSKVVQACTETSPYAGPFRKDAPSWCHAPFEPEGLLRSACLHSGHVLIHLKDHLSRLKHWLVMGVFLLILGVVLHFTSAVPLNKQLYSLSYVCLTAGAAALVFSAFYVLGSMVVVLTTEADVYSGLENQDLDLLDSKTHIRGCMAFKKESTKVVKTRSLSSREAVSHRIKQLYDELVLRYFGSINLNGPPLPPREESFERMREAEVALWKEDFHLYCQLQTVILHLMARKAAFVARARELVRKEGSGSVGAV